MCILIGSRRGLPFMTKLNQNVKERIHSSVKSFVCVNAIECSCAGSGRVVTSVFSLTY